MSYNISISYYIYLIFLSNSRLTRNASCLPGPELPHDLAAKTLQAMAQVASCLPSPSLGINGSNKKKQFYSFTQLCKKGDQL